MSKRITTPEDWERKKYGEIANITGGSTPSTDVDEYWGGDIEWVVPSEVTGRSSVEYSDTERKITKKGLDSSSTTVLPQSSVLMTSRATVGVPLINSVPMATNQGFQNFDLSESDEVTAYYLYYHISHNSNLIDSVASGGTFDEISNSELSKINISVPPLSEQRRIASVLYAVDERLRVLYDRRDELTDVKHGLMQDLLTGKKRVLDEDTVDLNQVYGNGSELTPDDIPSDWELKQLGDVCDINTSVNRESNKVDYLPMDAISEELPWPNYSEKRNPEDHSGTLFEQKDTLVAKITPCTENGKSAFIENLDSDFGIATTEVITLTPTEINPKYLYYYTESHPAKNYTISRMRGTSGRQRVPRSVFERELKIPLPSPEEQKQIASMLYTVDEMISNTGSQIENIERLKRGLMQDLLSGDVRTPEELDVLDDVVDTE